MGWYTLPKPGTDLGPCEMACQHESCKASRSDADSCCVHCGDTIGYERPFYYLNGGKLAHAGCHIDASNKAPRKGRGNGAEQKSETDR